MLSVVMSAVLAAGGWLAPVDGVVSRPFEPPAAAWAPGHRGVDFPVPPGTPVRSAAAGRVVFAGPAGGSHHVVVAHPDDLRTSYSYLSEVLVGRGQPVGAGDIVGRSGGTGPGHDGTVVHFGVRRGDRYVDPASYLGDRRPEIALAPLGGARPPHCSG